MTITTTDTVERYVGDGTQTAWPITFPFFKGEDVKACIVNSAGEQVNLVYGSEYTVTKSTGSIGGTLNYALSNNQDLTIWLSLPVTQETDFYNTGPLNAETLESSFDRLTLIAQQLQEASDRSVKVATSSTETPEQLMASLYAGRDTAVASASAAATSESSALASKQAAATSETNAAASKTAAATSAITAETWAESETPPDPNDIESKSAKSWALIAGDSVPIASTNIAGKAKTSASWQVDPETGVATVPVMIGATGGTDGTIGLVPQPVAGDEDKVLHGDSTYKYPSVIPIGLVSCVATATIPAGWLRYGTGTTLTGCNAAYPDFYDYVADSDNTCTLTEYETTLGLTGQCGKFGLDEDAGTVRMPTVKFVQNALGSEEIGTVNEAGLPNIEGQYGHYQNGYHTTHVESGALYYKSPYAGMIASSGDSNSTSYIMGFDASLYNDIYGNSDTVQPDSVSHYYVIHVYNAAVSASVAQAAEFVELLEGKADVSRTTTYITETWTNNTHKKWYRKWSDGFIEQGGVMTYNENSTKTVTYSTPFTTSAYSLVMSLVSTRAEMAHVKEFSPNSKDTTKFTVYCSTSNGNTFTWYAAGY